MNWKRARYFLLEILPRKGPDHIDKFIKSLEETEGQEHIAESLKNYLSSADEPDKGNSHLSLLTDDQIINKLSKGKLNAFWSLCAVALLRHFSFSCFYDIPSRL
jgi:hypothetical protein